MIIRDPIKQYTFPLYCICVNHNGRMQSFTFIGLQESKAGWELTRSSRLVSCSRLFSERKKKLLKFNRNSREINLKAYKFQQRITSQPQHSVGCFKHSTARLSFSIKFYRDFQEEWLLNYQHLKKQAPRLREYNPFVDPLKVII